MTKELKQRIITSIILIIAALLVITTFNEKFFTFFFIFIGIICCGEWIVVNAKTLNKLNNPPLLRLRGPGILASKKFYKYFSIYFFGVVYFLFILPLALFYLRFEESLYFLLIILFICICSDIGGYVLGKAIGGAKLTKISPNKTISGSIGSSVFSIFPVLIINLQNFKDFYFELNLENIIFSLFVSLACQLGDLFISYFKRLNKKKNTGTILPGHGGLLDRIDGMVFVLPSVSILKILGVV